MPLSLVGLDTEYGLQLDGRGAEDQIDDATALVRAYPEKAHVGWDYRYESPRSDLRGFKLDRLAQDPVDAKFDAGRKFGEAHEIRSDRVLPNGARFYNDHGHPEYATPECRSLGAIALHDCAGQIAVLRAARALELQIGSRVSVYKNNTDFHGASYGTHENYMVPRSLGFERLFRDVLPLLVVRPVLAGAGKVGSEAHGQATYQLSQRADFFTEAANAETLYRRPIFNTRDEPHAEAAKWIRLHVISGDSNMIADATARKVGLVRLALRLCENETAPLWRLVDPVRTIQAISRDEGFCFEIPLAGHSRTNAYEIFESYFAAAEATLELSDDDRWTIDTSRRLLSGIRANDLEAVRSEIDWAAKRHVLEQAMEEGGISWRDPVLRAYDLEYHNVDPDASLHAALVEMGDVVPNPPESDLLAALEGVEEPTRAFARGLAVRKFDDKLKGVCWRSVTFVSANGSGEEVALPPDVHYPPELADVPDVESFISLVRNLEIPPKP